jgi:hypothetical protein
LADEYAQWKEKMRIEELLEAVGGDHVYHSVGNDRTAIRILRSGVIKPNLGDEDEDAGWTIPSISTSRNERYRFPYGGGAVQFILDRSAIRQAGFKIMPFSYRQFYKDPAPENTPVSGNTLHKQETEERIYHKRGIGIPLKAPILVGMEINPKLKSSKTLLKLAKEMNIPVTNMKSFKQPPPPPPEPPKMKGDLLVDVKDIHPVVLSRTKEIEIWADVKSWSTWDDELTKGRQWLPLESGFKSKEEAEERAEQLRSDPAEFAKLKEKLKDVPLKLGY